MTTTEPRRRTAEQRYEAGKRLRDTIPRSSHAQIDVPHDRPDPVALLNGIAVGRLPTLLPIRNARMLESPFAFYRGSAAVMANDLSRTPSTGLTVQLCGDAHALNFGGYGTPERNIVFDVNDFDETLPGPFEWDLKRLATSFVLVARQARLGAKVETLVALTALQAYRTRMREFATMPALDIWYTRIDAHAALDEATSPDMRRQANKIAERAASNTIAAAVAKRTTGRGVERRFIDDPPMIFHSALTGREGFNVHGILAHYASTMPPETRVLFDRYTLVDEAIKVVGVGSVGMRCALALLVADDDDVLLLQIKEATKSVLEAYLEPSVFTNAGERVVRGQKLMQHASDAFLGFARSGEHDFYVRQFKDMKASAQLDIADADQMREYARYCGRALAAAHARSGDAASIAGYIGKSDPFDKALVHFALAYAQIAERDHAAFAAAAKTGAVSVDAAA